ncbi:type II secretion system protein N [Sulfitobacter sp. S190]|uniref:type II secretion system protein N n=1 Tax=Sulfitobacter sp. S190 TaxID=2867022 RepID=UPI0021A3AE53|nr:type II secretion system protein N [Sulfitobacter sp. S190]UWR23722.1 pilus assembly protein PilZ [Sulfitobacter sp. S190]
MATGEDGTPTPAKVKDLATEQARLDRTALIGIFGSSNAPEALIMLPAGKTEKVKVGDSVAGGTVEAIGEDRLVLSRNGNQQVMRLPKG